MYYTYILFSSKLNKYYTGQTIDLDRRLEEHNRGKTSFMKSGIPWELVYSTSFDTRKEAVNQEHMIKKRGAARFLSDLRDAVG